MLKDRPPGCEQEIEFFTAEGRGVPVKSVCGRTTAPRYSRHLEALDPELTKKRYKLCGAHRRLRRLYGTNDPRTMRPIEERKAQ